MPNSYTVVVRTKTKPEQWAYNGLRFSLRRDAESYAGFLAKRWSDVTETRIHETDDGANATYPVPSDRYDVPRVG